MIELNITDKIKSKDNKEKSHKSEYAGAIIFNLIFIYIVNNLLNWHISFITDSLNSILWIINLSIAVAVTGNFLLLLYDPDWLRHITKILMNIFAFIAAYFIIKVFPFNFSTAYLNEIVFVLIILGMIAIVIASLYELVMLSLLVKEKFSN